MAERGEYVPGPGERLTYTTHPARCNRRQCQARRNLSKHPALYAKWPRCHKCGSGLMYVDWYRKRKGPQDLPPICDDPCCPYPEQHVRAGGAVVPFHRVNTRGCSGYDDYVIDRSLAASKHCPAKDDGSLQYDETPF